MRGVLHHEETASGRIQLIVDELPYQVNKSTLIQRIADLVRAKRIEGISDLRDESDRDGMRIVIELGRTGSAATVENQLFRLTALQSTFAVNMLALVNRQPRTVSLREALEAFIDHRREVIRRRSEFDLEKARERAHILEGLLAALGQLDAVIAAIRASESADAAKTALMAEPFELSDRQAQARARHAAAPPRCAGAAAHRERARRAGRADRLPRGPAREPGEDRRADSRKTARSSRRSTATRAAPRSSPPRSRTSRTRTSSPTRRSSSRSPTAAT